MRLDDLLENSFREYPENIAVIDPGEREVSYRQLHQIATGISTQLKDIGVSEGDRVGIYAPKTAGTVASIFGVLKAGAAYVPVDPSAPPSRNAYIFSDCKVAAVIVERKLVENLARELSKESYELEEQGSIDALEPLGFDFVLLGTGKANEKPANSQSPSEDLNRLAYILYTSGSTGKPKGVMHSHSTALSFIDWCSEEMQPGPDDRFSSHAPFHFDLSILDLYLPIKHGAAIVVIGEDLGKQPQQLADVIAQQRISMWYSTPSILRLLVEYGKLEEKDYSALRIVNFAGEVFPIKYLRALKKIWAEPTYYNLYGPTETNVCTYYKVPSTINPERTEPFPIGQACSGDLGRVVDAQGNEVPTGSEGELYITGGSVMLGYWNLTAKTSEAFHVDREGISWYRTGDVVKKDDQGEYVFLGRRDRMVKRRGYRVELGEIESALYRHPSIAEAAVIAAESDQDDLLIKAFLSWSGDGRPSIIALKRFCAERLPLYMVPDRFSFQTELPKTSTDKIDYQLLKELD